MPAQRKALVRNQLILLDFIQQRAIADAEQARRRLAVPVSFLERVCNGIALGLTFGVPYQRLERRLLFRGMVVVLRLPTVVSVSIAIAVPRFRVVVRTKTSSCRRLPGHE